MNRAIMCACFALFTFGSCLCECRADLVKGVVKGIDIEVGTITIQVGGKGADIKIVKGKVAAGGRLEEKPQVFSLKSPSIPVLLADGKKARLDELKAGIPVTLQISDDEDVEAIVAGYAARSGTLLAVDAEKRQLTLQSGRKNPTTATYSYAADAAVTIAGVKKTVSELGVGQYLLLMMSLDQKNAVSIVASYRMSSDDPRGVIVGVDSTRGAVSLLVGRDGKFSFATWPVSSNFQFVFNEVERPGTKLSDLPVAANLTDLVQTPGVWLRLDHAQKTVAAIVAEPVTVPGILDSVDRSKRTLVARLADGKPRPFLLEPNADIRIGGKLADLENFNAGMSVQFTLSLEPGRLLAIRGKKP